MSAVKHRPMSEILAPAPEVPAKTENGDTPPVVEKPAPVAKEPEALPEKYKGKTVEQVIEMHQNAESRLGQSQTELGTMRGLVQDLSQLQRTPVAPQVEEQEPIDVSGDDLIQRPVETIRKVVAKDNAAQKVIDDAEALEQQALIESHNLTKEYGDINAIVGTPEFQKFALRTPTRQADLNTAATGEGLVQVRAARRLLEDFTDFQNAIVPVTPQTTEVVQKTPVEQAKEVSTEGAGPAGSISNKEVIYEADVLTMINDEPTKYRSPSFQAELTAAIKEGRFVKSG